MRRVVLRLSLAIGAISLAWAALILATGGFATGLFGLEITARTPLRPLFIGGLALGIRLLAGGAIPLAWIDRLGDWLAGERSRYLAWALAATVVALGIIDGSKVAGGQDSFGYVSEAEMLRHGRLKIDQAFALDAPWPNPEFSFAPLAWTPWPADHRYIVPIYPAGLPALFAAAKAVGGQAAMFAVVPVAAGIFVFSTFSIGRRLGLGAAALGGAWLVATSPPMLLMTMNPMTDVPVAAALTASFALMLRRRAWTAAAAGLGAGLAILIRPNLVPLVGVMGAFYLLDLIRPGTRRRALGHGALFGLTAASGLVAIMLLNAHLWGSPLASGLGDAAQMFKAPNVLPNLRIYLGTLVDTHTPIVLAGFLPLLVPVRAFWPAAPDRRVVIVAALYVCVLWAMYCAYAVLGEWWYLRYLLASWPFIMLGVGAVTMAIGRRLPALARVALAIGIIALGVHQLHVTGERSVWSTGVGESRYVVAADLTRRVTPDNSVVIAGPHNGAIRYYAGRLTLRYDQLDPAWLDRAVAWLASRGVRTFFALEDWEVPQMRERFAGARCLAAFDRPPAGAYLEPGKFYVFELSGDATAPTTTVTGIYSGAAPPQPLVLPAWR